MGKFSLDSFLHRKWQQLLRYMEAEEGERLRQVHHPEFKRLESEKIRLDSKGAP